MNTSGFTPGFRFVRLGNALLPSSLHSQLPVPATEAASTALSAAASGCSFASIITATSSKGAGAALSTQRKPHSSASIPMPIARKSRHLGFPDPFATRRSSPFRRTAHQPSPPTKSSTARQERTSGGKASGTPLRRAYARAPERQRTTSLAIMAAPLSRKLSHCYGNHRRRKYRPARAQSTIPSQTPPTPLAAYRK